MSRKTSDGKDFMVGYPMIVKKGYLFTIYSDHIVYIGEENVIYKIYKKTRYLGSMDYLVTDQNGQYFDIKIYDNMVDKKHVYDVTLLQTDKKGKWLSITRFDLNKIQ